MARSATREKRWLAALLVVATVALFVTAIPETFTVDECNYFATVHALRDGGLFVPGTGELTPSRELVGFDPVARRRKLERGRITSNAPPLYAPLALPFSYLGWRWLVLVNLLAFAWTTWLVADLAARFAKRRTTGWVAAGLFALGGFSVDYAQGVWPHMLSAGLMMAAVWSCTRARHEDRLSLAAAAGLLAGFGAGVRYQNVVFAFTLAITLLVWAKRRWRLSAAYAAGCAVPVGITALINHARLGSFNPVSKGAWYLPKATPGTDADGSLLEPFATVWVRVVDFSAHPPFQHPLAAATLPKDPRTGAFLVIGGLKKALLQSAPWIAIAIAALVLVWTSRTRMGGDKRRVLRGLAIPVLGVLALFGWAGLERYDGWAFNQRYLLELVPLLAVSAALVIDDWELDAQKLILGGALGAALAAIPVIAARPEHAFRQRALMIAPLVIAAACLLVWALRRAAPWRAMVVAAAVAWSLVVHVGDDMVASRGLREWNGFQRQVAAQHLPQSPSALIAISPQKEAMCPLHLDHDLVLVDPQADRAETLNVLVGELLAANRRVFVMGGMPDAWLAEIFRGRRMKLVSMKPMPFAEVLPQSSGGDASLQQRKPVE